MMIVRLDYYIAMNVVDKERFLTVDFYILLYQTSNDEYKNIDCGNRDCRSIQHSGYNRLSYCNTRVGPG
jgi:hypothetical protein